MNLFKSVVFAGILMLFNTSLYALSAFPGAEGFGTNAIGGRNAASTVYIVSNLNDSGTGSLRAALTASGPRYIVFSVSGVINLSSVVEVTNPYLTIAGQTSPGGIALSGGRIRISTHDVVITHLRFRLGSKVCDGGTAGAGTDCDQAGDTLQVMSDATHPAYNIVIDHCSFAWGADETLDISAWYGDTYDVTVSNCLIGQGLDNAAPEGSHALGFLISGHYQKSRNITISVHHNYISHFRYRFPIIASADVDLYNNVMYNYDSFTTQIDRNKSSYPDSHLNTRHNFFKEGPSTQSGNSCTSAPNKSIGLIWDEAGTNYAMTGTPTPLVHSVGNIGCSSLGDTTGKFASGYWGNSWPWLASGWISTNPISAATAGTATVTTMSSSYAATVVANAGATKPSRDSLDIELVNDYTNRTGTWKTDMHYPTGWPTYPSPAAPTDSDQDGMSDAWEIATYGSISVSPHTVGSDGYSYLEKYIHYLGGYSSGQSLPDTTPPATPTGITTTIIQ